MKNLKIYKKAVALLAASSFFLLSGCTVSSEDKTKETKEESCTHLTVYFEDSSVTFKECEGYRISAWDSNNGGELHYNIAKDDNVVIYDGITQQYNLYKIYHSVIDELINNESIQKTK